MPSLRSPLLREIGAIYRSIQSIMELRFRNKQLQRGQFIFLTRICEHPGIKQVELTRMCRVDKGTTAKAVRKLMEAGYVLRKPDSVTDGRGICFLQKKPDRYIKRFWQKKTASWRSVSGACRRKNSACF